MTPSSRARRGGADTLCADVARELGATIEPHPAKWGLYGHVAGMIRNIEILNSGVDLLVSFLGGRGTRHCTDKAREMGIPVIVAKEVAGAAGSRTGSDGEDGKTAGKEPPSPDAGMPVSQHDVPSDAPSEDDPWTMLLNSD